MPNASTYKPTQGSEILLNPPGQHTPLLLSGHEPLRLHIFGFSLDGLPSRLRRGQGEEEV